MARVPVRAVVFVLLILLVPVGPALADDAVGDPTLEQPDPDGDQNGGADRPGGEGGYDDDRDDDNGCGNEDDGEDDNRGRCRGLRDADPEDDPEHDGDVFTSTSARQPPSPTRAPAPAADTPRTTAPASAATTPVQPAPPHPVRSRLARQNAEGPSPVTTAASFPQPLRLQGVGAEAGTVLAISVPVAGDDPGALAIAGGMIATLLGLALATLVGGSLLLRRHTLAGSPATSGSGALAPRPAAGATPERWREAR